MSEVGKRKPAVQDRAHGGHLVGPWCWKEYMTLHIYISHLASCILKLIPDFNSIIIFQPVTVAERSKACSVFARSEAVTVVSNPTQGMDVWDMYAFFCVCVILCLGSGLETGQSLVQGVLQSVK
jgi:hypothetical protein